MDSKARTDRGASMMNVNVTCTVIVCSLLMSALTAEAQPVGSSPGTGRSAVSGYVFAGPALDFNEGCEVLDADRRCLQSTWRVEVLRHLGAGLEYRFFEAFGVLAEASAVASNDAGSGLLSVNGAYHFRDTPSTEPSLVPFATGGYSVVSGSVPSFFNLGGGVDYWTRRGIALRLEARSYLSGGERVLDLRIGMSFRRR